jgi:hypothetical protein
MPNRDGVWNEIVEAQGRGESLPFDFVRRKYLLNLFNRTNRNIVAYYTAFVQKNGEQKTSLDLSDNNRFMRVLSGLDKAKGLDLILHLPGGSVAAADAIVKYLRSYFNGDIRVIVPEFAFSAGTMIACHAKSVLLGRHSSLGPADPHWRGFSANNLLAAFENAKRDAATTSGGQSSFLERRFDGLPASFVEECSQVLAWGRKIVEGGLSGGMFKDLPECDREGVVKRLADLLLKPEMTLDHSRPIQYQELKDHGMVVELMESDSDLQDAILSLHHSYVAFLELDATLKMVENHNLIGSYEFRKPT